MSLFDMMLGDELLYEINNLPSDQQRTYFLSVYERLKKYVQETDESLTFGEFLRMYPG